MEGVDGEILEYPLGEIALGRPPLDGSGAGLNSIKLSQASGLLLEGRYEEAGSGTGPILLSQATFLLAHIANNGPVPLPLARLNVLLLPAFVPHMTSAGPRS